MKMIKQLIMIICACQILSGCNQQDTNPLNQKPAKEAAVLILKATKIANTKVVIPPLGDNYLTCLKQNYDDSACRHFYSIMTIILQKNGMKIDASQVASLKPSAELVKEIEYQALIDDEV
ncbi:hypothetical protein SC828_09015 [Legionella pneumophila serogroup 1]